MFHVKHAPRQMAPMRGRALDLRRTIFGTEPQRAAYAVYRCEHMEHFGEGMDISEGDVMFNAHLSSKLRFPMSVRVEAHAPLWPCVRAHAEGRREIRKSCGTHHEGRACRTASESAPSIGARRRALSRLRPG
jgi:hypothetical protein